MAFNQMLGFACMKIAIGILAHNEEQRIEGTIASLLKQTIFDLDFRERAGVDCIQVACVANGCIDKTSERVKALFDRQSLDKEVSLEVHEVVEAGKSRSWNLFVHSVSDASAKFLILVDADIEFGTDDVLEKLIRHFEANPNVLLTTDKPIKLIQKRRQSVQGKLSLMASDQRETAGSLSGQLYCGRSSELRKIWMPLSLPVEDGFLAAMIVTNGFTEPARSEKIAEVSDAYHYYDSHETISEFFRHESRIIVGSTINSWLFSLLWSKGQEGHVGSFIRDQNLQRPAWLDELAEEQAANKKWVVPVRFLFKRMRPLKNKAIPGAIKIMPIALLSTLAEIIACVQANQILRRSGSARFW